MVQFNLLPDVKLQYVKARRAKHLVTVSALLVSGAALGILVLLFFTVSVFQKKYMDDLTRDIKTSNQKLQAVPDINKVLTIQNQLATLSTLHDQKPLTSRFFAYINQLTPSTVTVGSANLDFTAGTLSLDGNAPDLSTVNKFVDTLKFTTYKLEGDDTPKKPFSSVVLSSFSLSANNAKPDKKASYQISLVFDKVIFDITKSVALEVPKQITTRSETEKPNLFQFNSSKTDSQGTR